MSRAIDFEEETFIMAVAEYKCLYDTSLKAYKDVLMKENAWKEIMQSIHFKGDVKEIMKKWDLLKDKFCRIRKKYAAATKKSGSGATCDAAAKDWPLFTIFDAYFGEYIKRRPRQTNLSIKTSQPQEDLSQVEMDSEVQDLAENILGRPLQECVLEAEGCLYPANGDSNTDSATPAPKETNGESPNFSMELSNTPVASSSSSSSSNTNARRPLPIISAKRKTADDAERLFLDVMESMKDVLSQESKREEKRRSRNQSEACCPTDDEEDEIFLAFRSYAKRVRALPEEYADEIRCNMENWLRDARNRAKNNSVV